MPAFSSHYIFACELMDFTRNLNGFEADENAVLLGAQGPDIFFSHRVFPWMTGKSLRPCGSALHRASPTLIFDSMRSASQELTKNTDSVKSYICGFIMHYALDRKCHPYIYYLQNKITQASPKTNPHTAHNEIEFSLDSYLLNRRMGIKHPYAFDTAATFLKSEKGLDEIGRLLTRTVAEATDMSITPFQAIQAARDTKAVQSACLDASGIKRRIIAPAERLAAPFTKNFLLTAMLRPRDLQKATRYANINNGCWKSPFSNEASRLSFEELFEQAKADACRMITEFFSGKDCREITENKSFLTGVEIE